MNIDQGSSGLINQSPRPRLLVYGFSESPELVERILAEAPTSRPIDSLDQVRQAEWDVLITDQPLEGLKPHLCVVFLAHHHSHGGLVERRPAWQHFIVYDSGVISQELRRQPDLAVMIQELVREHLEPVLFERDSHLHFDRRLVLTGGTLADAPELQPFITTADGHILAGRYGRSDCAEAWLLPYDTPDLIPWVRAALREWHSLTPDRFPGVPDWSHEDEWSTEDESDLRAELRNLREETEAAARVLEARELDLKQQLAAAREDADAGDRVLLTGSGDELVAAVRDAFMELGFDVVDADARSERGELLEDLHVSDTHAPDWVALVEVKGYTRGARTEALTQLMRFQTRYTHSHRRLADALWYVVNQFRTRDPGTRQPVLHSNDGDVDAFADGKGLIIDTVDLFRLRTSVRAGDLSAEDGRKALRDSTGRWKA